ncbi:uncharacterized protein E0L32_008048 [Thyridium curvatum]|uniref:Zn(2)-C6 fungal-type domain-containing protein n=1 Tax=Thyridium curvatum TaxID=1093900 RepID=A0A507B1S0_9PEZI|nr:uncharacterized protein E0L32_008048 [Thyridium curvatum]TPX11011.1 hypothetical protein E0L32_008048 [Thyridium curvatum]
MDYTQPLMPMITLDAEPADFEYGAFLEETEDVDVDYMAEESSTSNTSRTVMGDRVPVLAAHGSSSSSSPSTALTATAQPGSGKSTSSTSPPKQRLERRGHTKSRRGCFNCKRRRIKCQENKPACGHCVKSGLKCEYPSVPQVTYQPQHQIPLFSLQDMRFFQHFLLRCYPHHPLGNESIWTHEIPCLSQEYEYLMHAVLGLAASDLMQYDPSLVEAAMQHRLKAIRAIKKTLAGVPKASTFEEGNAMMATCFALTFQSVLLDDGMCEYMTFIRGVIIVAIQMYVKGCRFLFVNLMGDDQLSKLKPFLEEVAPMERSWGEGAVAAVRGLEPLCTGEVERAYYELLLGMAEALLDSPLAAWQSISRHYSWWMQLPHDKFQQIVDPTSTVFALLGAHWIAIKQTMATVTSAEHKCRDQSPSVPARMSSRQVAESMGRKGSQGQAQGQRQQQQQSKECLVDLGMCRWLKYLNASIGPEWQVYNAWPMWVEARLDENPRYFGLKGDEEDADW